MPLLRMSSGAIVWALHFMTIYGVTALACARGAGAVVPWAIAIATALAIAAALAVMLLAVRGGDFNGWLTATIGGLALIAIVWEALPVLAVPTCG